MWYSDFFDTVRMSYDNQDKNVNYLIAEQIMKIAIIGGKRIVLSQTQAFDLKLLSDNINNKYFNELLFNSKVVFKSHNNKNTVLEAFIDSLKKRGDTNNAFFKYSSLKFLNEGSISDLNLKRDLALQYIIDKNSQSVDTEIQDYCDSVRIISERLHRTDSGVFLKKSINNIMIENKDRLLPKHLHQYLNMLLDTSDRSRLYKIVEIIDISENNKAVLNSYVDVCYNFVVGSSLTNDITLTGNKELSSIEGSGGSIVSIGPFDVYKDKIVNTRLITWEVMNNEFNDMMSQEELIESISRYSIKRSDSFLSNVVFSAVGEVVQIALGKLGLFIEVPPSILGLTNVVVAALPFAYSEVKRKYKKFELRKCFKTL